jgi:hypothetical protein
MAHREGADHRVEGGVGDVECFRIAFPELDAMAQLNRTSPGDRQHVPAEVDTSQPDVGRVVLQVQAGTDGDLEHLTGHLCTDPTPGVAKQHPVEEPHLAVVGRGMPFPVTAPPRTPCAVGNHAIISVLADRTIQRSRAADRTQR